MKRHSVRPHSSQAAIEALAHRVLLSSYTVTNLNDSGPGSLRDAVQHANASPDASTITFAATLTGTISLTSGPLEISNKPSAIKIDDPGAGISLPISTIVVAGDSSRTFQVDPGANARFSGLEVAGFNGGIENEGTLRLTACSLFGNLMQDGGAIYNDGGSVYISQSILNGGALRGGSIFNNFGTAKVSGSEFSGGDVYNNGGTVSVINSSFPAGKIENTATAVLVQDTFSTSSVYPIYDTGDLTVEGCTIQNGNGSAEIEIPIGATDANVTLYNTICDGITGTFDQRLRPGEIPSSYNLIGTGGAGGLVNGVNGNIVGVNAKLAGFYAYGGPTETMLPLPGSPAIGAGSKALAMDFSTDPPTPLPTDARGFARIYNGRLDIGAVETQPLLVNTANESTAPGQLSLLNAFVLAQISALPGGVIRFDTNVFAPGAHYTIYTDGEAAPINQTVNVTIDGLGADVLTVNVVGGPITVLHGGTLSISGLNLVGVQGGGPIYIEGTVNLTRCDLSAKNGNITHTVPEC